MLRRNKQTAEAPAEPKLSPLDRLVIQHTGKTPNLRPFDLILREATIERALSTDPAWPPVSRYEAAEMYIAYRDLYDEGEMDGIVAELDLNEVVANAGRLALSQLGGTLPPRRNWPEPEAV